MEFTLTQLAIINAIMPFKYKIEVYSKSESKTSKPVNRKTEAESLISSTKLNPRIPEKRPPREVSKSFDKTAPKAVLSGSSNKLEKIYTALKKTPELLFLWDFVTNDSFPEFKERFATPMDLSMVDSRLSSGLYNSNSEFIVDVLTILNTGFSFFAGNLEVYSSMTKLGSKFEEICRDDDSIIIPNKIIDPLKVPDRIPKLPQVPKQEPPKAQDKPLGYFEKKQLCDNIKKLEPRYLKGVLEIVKECTDMKGEELEFDVDKLPPRVCRELDKYVKECVGSKGRRVEEVRKEVDVGKAEPAVQAVVQVKNDVYLPEESESESSSTSESEEEEFPSSGFFAGDDFEVFQ